MNCKNEVIDAGEHLLNLIDESNIWIKVESTLFTKTQVYKIIKAHKVMFIIKQLFLLIFISLSVTQTAFSETNDQSIQKLLSSSKLPVGVVFEIASSDNTGLEWAVPLVTSYANQLRAKFPDIKLAVVSHGLEQFQLTKANRKEHANTHNQIQSLIKDQNIEMHVCGNFAGMMGVDRDEFVDFVKVVDRAPLQVEAFQDLGYKLIFVSKPKDKNK